MAAPPSGTDTCRICLAEMEDPCVIGTCKHAFCRECIHEWAAMTLSCPLCRSEVDFTKFGPPASGGEERVACRLHGCYAKVLHKNLGKHISRCHPIFRCDACGHTERVRALMNAHDERDCPYRALKCPSYGCREGVRACDYSEDPRALFQHHQCHGVFRCEEHDLFFASAEELGVHLGCVH